MNEKIHKVFIAMRWYVVVFLAGAILAGAALYFTAIKSGDKLISEYQRTTAQLAEDYQRVQTIIPQLKSQIATLQKDSLTDKASLTEQQKKLTDSEAALAAATTLSQQLSTKYQNLVISYETAKLFNKNLTYGFIALGVVAIGEDGISYP